MKRVHRRRTGVAKSKIKVLSKILFVIVAAAVITALAVLLGTHLKNKADSAESLIEEISSDLPDGIGRDGKLLPEGVLSDGRDRNLSVRAADLDISSVPEDEIISRILDLPGSYNAVSIRVTDNGTLVYSSPAVARLVREKAPDTAPKGGDGEPVVPTVQTVSDLAAVAKREGLRVCAIYRSTPAALGTDGDARLCAAVDSAVIGELVSLGADEILVGDLLEDDSTLDFSALCHLISYLSELRQITGSASLGVLLPARVFSDATTAAQVVSLSDYADVLAIEVPVEGAWDEESAYNAVDSACYPIRGSFSAYNLRAVVSSDVPEFCAGAYRALGKIGVTNVQFSAFLRDLPQIEENAGEQTETEDESSSEFRTNENAMTHEKYGQQTETDAP